MRLWRRGIGIALALPVLAICLLVAVRLFQFYAYPKFFRPATDAEMEEIAVAALPVAASPSRDWLPCLLSIRIAGRDAPTRLLPRLSRGAFIAYPASMVPKPDGMCKKVEIDRFKISPFGEAIGTIETNPDGELGRAVYDISLHKSGGKWIVTRASQGVVS